MQFLFVQTRINPSTEMCYLIHFHVAAQNETAIKIIIKIIHDAMIEDQQFFFLLKKIQIF